MVSAHRQEDHPAQVAAKWAWSHEAFQSFSAIFDERLAEADEFYGALTEHALSDDQRMVIRQALAGMLWSKQFYHYDLDLWLREHGVRRNAVDGGPQL